MARRAWCSTSSRAQNWAVRTSGNSGWSRWQIVPDGVEIVVLLGEQCHGRGTDEIEDVDVVGVEHPVEGVVQAELLAELVEADMAAGPDDPGVQSANVEVVGPAVRTEVLHVLGVGGEEESSALGPESSFP